MYFYAAFFSDQHTVYNPFVENPMYKRDVSFKNLKCYYAYDVRKYRSVQIFKINKDHRCTTLICTYFAPLSLFVHPFFLTSSLCAKSENG